MSTAVFKESLSGKQYGVGLAVVGFNVIGVEVVGVKVVRDTEGLAVGLSLGEEVNGVEVIGVEFVGVGAMVVGATDGFAVGGSHNARATYLSSKSTFAAFQLSVVEHSGVDWLW
jgi:hypothetical protein